ncbi:hypothetical protein C0Q70_18263 [Pomacea canaliculata]|uniref:RRM domain-containing protein n=1 Tax=Pomacea canaliculata TaxID=400727 RepID=A0A2T7NMQ1_POMCA|nr:ELAV-like protein 1-B isoform X2 [Pomacea canaliculata]PVD22449.1 hypothetical protein C0Q70_18263 [Pomacea canaliculata]
MEDVGQGLGEESPTNLIINYLPQTLTDEEYRSMFLSIGPIKSAKIIRDKATGYSYGFGFVDYQHAADAERAIQTLNGLQLQNKRIKVARARMGGENIKGANLYIRNLPIPWTENELNKLFEPYGKIIQSRVLVDLQTGVSKRVGFVLYNTRQEAEAAIRSVSGTTPEGCTEPILIKFADDNSKKMRPPNVQYVPSPIFPGHGPGPMRNQGNRFRYNPMSGNYNVQSSTLNGGYVIFAYNIGNNATERTLWQLFSPFGTVQKVNVVMEPGKGVCKGYGFVTMTNFQEAQNAINHLNGFYFQGRPLQVSFKT